MPPTTTTSTHCSHCTLHFCVLLLLVLLSGYHCQDICVDYPERLECISKINSNSNINCTEIEGECSSHLCVYMHCVYIIWTVNRV